MAFKKREKNCNATAHFDESIRSLVQSYTARSTSQSKSSSSTRRTTSQDIVFMEDEADDCCQNNQENPRSTRMHGASDPHCSVWEHMDKLIGEKARCNICDTVLSRKNSGTTGLRKHLHQVHHISHFAASSITKRSKITTFSSEMKKKLDALVVKCIVEDARSFTDLRRPGIMKIFQQLVPGPNNVDRHTVLSSLCSI